MIRHLSGLSEIVEDVEQAAAFYKGLGLEIEWPVPGYAVVKVPGVLHFGLWGRRDAAESTFGDADAVDKVALGFTIGLEVDSVDGDAGTLDGSVLRGAHDEPWGQRTLRFRSPSGAICEICETPGARQLTTDAKASG